MKIVAIVLVSLICVSGLVFVAYFIGVTSDDRRLDIARETALIRAEADRDAMRADSQVKVISAQAKLEQARLSSDAQVLRALRARAYLSAWFPVYFPILLFAGVATLTATYYTFRLVEYKDDSIQTKVRVYDSARLVDRSLQVKAIEASQGIDVLQLAENISHRQLSVFGGMMRGMRGIMGREQVTINNALPPANIEQPVNVPNFSELLDAGKFQQGSPLLFGFSESGSPKMGTWQDAYSLGVAGLSGFGKSATIRFLMAESLLTKAVGKFYVIDPHFPHEKSLLASLGDLKDAPQVRYADNPFDTGEMLTEIHAAIDRRLQGQEPSEPLLVVVIDEMIPVVKKYPKVAELVERIGTESRKAGVYGIFASQSWNGDKTGGTTARDNLTALLVHRMKPKQANTLLQDSELARKVTRLGKGKVLFAPVNDEPELLTVPFCSREDMPEVVRLLSGGEKVYQKETQQQAQPMESTPETIGEIDSLTDAQLIARVNLKKGMMGNNELARFLELDEGLTSKSLRGLALPLFPAVRTAFKNFLQSV